MKRNLMILAAGCLLAPVLVMAAPQDIRSAGRPAVLEIRPAGENAVRISLMPASMNGILPPTPLLAEGRKDPAPILRLETIAAPVAAETGNLKIGVSAEPLAVTVTDKSGRLVQRIVFGGDGSVAFHLDGRPVLGLGEGGPRITGDWRSHPIEFDRRGRDHEMIPRWQANAYGSRNPAAVLVGTGGWGIYVAEPWVEVDLRGESEGRFIPWTPPQERGDDVDFDAPTVRAVQGRPPVHKIIPGFFDMFVFEASDPQTYLKEWAAVTGPAVMPPKWALGYMQSHRTLQDDAQLTGIVKTFREKKIPVDAVIYLGTGFCPRGWNTPQPSFDFNPEVFKREPRDVIADLHRLNVKVVNHIVPWRRDKLPTISGNIPPASGEAVGPGQMFDYWLQHEGLVKTGVDAWWPDEGDWFNLYERIARHKLYYLGPLSSKPNVRPWSLHRNGHPGIAQWGGWVWSGDTDSSWKTLEGQIAVGINHSLSLSPYWGSDIGGFYPNEELTGELYARWFQFGAFCPSFRAHGRTWWTRLPWGWGLSEMGPKENERNPLESELNNPAVEPICRQYAELRYRLLPYIYTLAWEARTAGLPLMRAMWIHYPDDVQARALGDQYLWGRDMLIAPVYKKGAASRDVYLPAGTWYDWWTGKREEGSRTVSRAVDLSILPIYVRAGAIIPLDPVRQYTGENVSGPMTIRIFEGVSGAFELYEDDGTSQDYLSGKYSLIRFVWDDKEKVLSVERRPGPALTAAPSSRELAVELVPSRIRKTMTWDGAAVQVKIK